MKGNRVFVGLILLLWGVLFANNGFTVIEKNPNRMLIKFELPKYKLADIEIENTKYKKIVSEIKGFTQKSGYPQLPVYATAIGLPEDGDFASRIVSSKQKTVNNVLIEPVQTVITIEEAKTVSNSPNAKAYSTNSFYPGSLTEKKQAVWAGLRKYSSLIVKPFQYNTVTKKLNVYTEIIIEVVISGNTAKKRSLSYNLLDNSGFIINDEFSKYWKKQNVISNVRNEIETKVSRIKIITDTDGIYKVTKQDILASLKEHNSPRLSYNINSIDPRNYELYDEYGPVPIHFVGENDGSFDDGDYFEFYGKFHRGDTGYLDNYTSENTYFLELTNRTGTRMAVENGGLKVFNANNYRIPKQFKQTVHFEEQRIRDRLSWYKQRNPFETVRAHTVNREDRWFWSYITAPALERFAINLEYPSNIGVRYFDARVCVTGLTVSSSTSPDHHAYVRIQSDLIGEESWFGQDDVIFATDENSNLSNSHLVHGENSLYVTLPGDTEHPTERIMLDWVEIDYWREYRTDKDELVFTKPQNKPFGLYQFELFNFSSSDVSIYKIGSSVMENIQIEAFTDNGSAPYTITFQDSVLADEVKYIAVTEAKKHKAIDIKPDIPSNLKNANQACDYVFVVHPDFYDTDPLNELIEIHENFGKTVKIVKTDDIYDEFNFGIRSAEAIKDFFTYAFNNWGTPGFSHAVLVGDGHLDERDWKYQRKSNKIPVYKHWLNSIGAVAADMWYACVVGTDPVPDFAIGRVNAIEIEDLQNYVDKVKKYLNPTNTSNDWKSKVILVGGGAINETYDIFAQQNEDIRTRQIPESYNVKRVYGAVTSFTPRYQGRSYELREAFNKGAYYIQFMGHGGGQVWDDYGMLKLNHIPSLTNENLPIIVSLSCLGSAFDTPGDACIGEAITIAKDYGAIAHLGFTGLSLLLDDLLYGLYLTEGMFNKNFETFGQAVNYTLNNFYAVSGNVNNTYTLLMGSCINGLPTLPLYTRLNEPEITLSSHNVSVGDTIKIEATFPPEVTEARFVVCDENEFAVNIPFNEIIYPVVNGKAEYEYYIDPEIYTEDTYKRWLRVYGRNEANEYAGITRFEIGSSTIMDNKIIPELPTEGDSIYVAAKLFDKDGINKAWVQFVAANEQGETQIYKNEMYYNSETGFYQTSKSFRPLTVNSTQIYHIYVEDNNQEVVYSEEFKFKVTAADLVLKNLELHKEETNPYFRAFIKNVGLLASKQTTIDFFTGSTDNLTQIASADVIALEPQQEFIIDVALPILNQENVHIFAYVNKDERDFVEISNDNANNKKVVITSFNSFSAGVNVTNVSSIDDNLELSSPASLLAENQLFFLDKTTDLTPYNQNGVSFVALADSSVGTAYNFGCYNKNAFADSLGVFAEGRTVKLSFNYHDSLSTDYISKCFVYRWEGAYEKWIYQGGLPDFGKKQVVYLAKRLGTYALMYNTDNVPPSIEANVEKQEFTHGGYIAGNGIISLSFNDSDGIDIFDNDIAMYLNGQLIPTDKYSQSASFGHLTCVPIKYQLDLPKGEYSLLVSAVDVNGNYNEHELHFIVNNKFDVIKLANYPNPIISKAIDPVNIGRTRFTYVLTDDADKVDLKVFTVSGRLVKTFKNIPSSVGYHEYPRTVKGWSATDEQGMELANGVYFYKIIAKKGSKTVEKVQKMAITK